MSFESESIFSMSTILFSMRIRGLLSRWFIKRATFDELRSAHDQLEMLLRNFLPLRGAHHQDLWVLSETGLREGYFVEFGGYDGVASSNTLILEKSFGWSGIVVEPGIGFRESLLSSRSCILDFRAVWDKSGESILFDEDVIEGYLSVASEDKLVVTQNNTSKYSVDTVTLLDLLDDHDAPNRIDYISVDIEGSELRVLREFFKSNSQYEVKCWTVEHNFRGNRTDLENLFARNGYRAIHKELSYRDYWFKLE